MSKMLRIEGMNWKDEFGVEVEEREDNSRYIVMREDKFRTMLSVLASTHDMISGGFRFEIEEE